ncbi:MAG: hypothetical protein Q8M17_16180 [Actinomycetota bacterium]|nr:hypothetical protein [Actinomycetota bacterium]
MTEPLPEDAPQDAPLDESLHGAATAADAAPDEPEPEPETFGREYVASLRAEAAEARVRAKRTDEANARLAAAYAASTGRLVDAEALAYTDDLLGDDGLVDRDKVGAAVDVLVAAKPYLAKRTPTTPIAQGMRESAPPEIGWLAVVRDGVR